MRLPSGRSIWPANASALCEWQFVVQGRYRESAARHPAAHERQIPRRLGCHQSQFLEQYLRRQLAGVGGGIVLRGHLYDIRADDIESAQRTQ